MVVPVAGLLAASLLGAHPLGTPDLRVSPQVMSGIPSEDYRLNLGGFARPKVTKAILIGVAVALVLDEIIIVRDRPHHQYPWQKPPTISQVLQQWARDYSSLPFTFGVLSGHWFWNKEEWPPDSRIEWNVPVLIASAVLMILWDIKVAIWGESRFERSIRRQPFIPLAAGIIVGHEFWPQRIREPSGRR